MRCFFKRTNLKEWYSNLEMELRTRSKIDNMYKIQKNIVKLLEK
jgi:hypothetical protein